MSSGPCWSRHPGAPLGHAARARIPVAAALPPDDAPEDAPDVPPGVANPQSEQCDVCGSADTWWRNCKLLCRACGSIVKSCADL